MQILLLDDRGAVITTAHFHQGRLRHSLDTAAYRRWHRTGRLVTTPTNLRHIPVRPGRAYRGERGILPMLSDLASKIGGRLRLSNNGVPHVVMQRNDRAFSVCYFGERNIFRIFHNEQRQDFDGFEKVVIYFQSPILDQLPTP